MNKIEINLRKSFINYFFFFLSFSLFVGCDPTNSWRMLPYEELHPVNKRVSPGEPISYDPSVDVVIVVDDSERMKFHHETTIEAIDKMTDSFVRNVRLNFRLGAVSVWDHERFSDPEILAQRKTELPKRGRLLPLRDSNGFLTDEEGEIIGPNFIDRNTKNYVEIIKETLKVEITDRDYGGPEFESLFTPVIDALKPEVNPDFFRPDAELLVVIFISDANDESPLTASQFYTDLLRAKGGDSRRVLIYSFMVNQPREITLANGKKILCRQDPGGPPVKINELLEISGGIEFDLCDVDSLDDAFRSMGKEIQRAASVKRIGLSSVPLEESIEITFGDRKLLQHEDWILSFKPRNEIMIFPEALLEGSAEDEIKISWIPIRRRNLESGNLGFMGSLGSEKKRD